MSLAVSRITCRRFTCSDMNPDRSKLRTGRQTLAKGLVTNYGEGGLQNGRGGAREVLPLRKGGGGPEKVLAMLKGGHNKFWGSFYTVA